MGRTGLIRDYENIALPTETRVASLARRFPCLHGAPGLDPLSPSVFFAWLETKSEDSAARHAGLLILNLLGKGAWPPFDAIRAIAVFDDKNKMIFGNWVRCWYPPDTAESTLGSGTEKCPGFSPPLTLEFSR